MKAVGKERLEAGVGTCNVYQLGNLSDLLVFGVSVTDLLDTIRSSCSVAMHGVSKSRSCRLVREERPSVVRSRPPQHLAPEVW